MEVFVIAALSFILGIILSRLATKKDGRLIIDGDNYFVAITTRTEELKKRKQIHLKVITK